MAGLAAIFLRDCLSKRQTISWRMRATEAQDSAGQALLELAFSFSILLIILVGVAEVGRYAHAAIEVSNAARAGVQYGAQTRITASDYQGMQQAAINDAIGIPVMTATASHFCACSNGTASTCLATDCAGARMIEFVQVNTTATVSPIFRYPGLSQSLTLTGQAVMRVEK